MALAEEPSPTRSIIIRLSDETKLIAEKELREDPSKVLAGVDCFRSWLHANQNIRRCRSDDGFLLRFLRAAKYDLTTAQTRLKKYLHFRQTKASWSENLDIQDARMVDLVDRGILFVVPERDEQGRRVIFNIAGKIDPAQHSSDDLARLYLMTFETLLEDEENQVRGVVHICDGRGLTFAHVTSWSPADIAAMLTGGEKCYPLRHKMMHLINLPCWTGYVVRILRKCFSKKLQERLLVHSNGIEDVSRTVPLRILPKEYGGSIPAADMTSMWAQEVKQHRKNILAIDDAEIDLEESQWS